MVFRLNMLRRDVEELKEKTWELDSTTRNNLGTHFYHTLWKKFAVFLSPAGMSLTKLSLASNILIIPGQGELG
jgi:hypothetical protein